MDRQRYMELIGGQIRCRRAVPLVTKELEAHIEEQKKDFLAEGMPENEAEEMAVREMGDPVAVGIQMDAVHRPRMNWGLIFLIGFFSAAGVLLWYGLNIRAAGGAGGTPDKAYPLFFRYAAGTAAGFLCMVGICYMDYTWFAVRAKKIMLIYSGILLLIPVVLAGPMDDAFSEGYTAAVWLMAFLFLPLYCGVLFSYRGQGLLGFIKGAAWMLPIVGSLLVYRNRLEMLMFLVVLAAVLSYAVAAGTFCIPVKRTVFGIWAVTALLSAGVLLADGLTSFGIMPEVYEEFMTASRDTVRGIIAGSHALGSAGESLGVQGGTFGFTVGVQGRMLELTEVFPVGSELMLTYTAACFGTFAAFAAVLAAGALFLRMLVLTMRQKNRLGRMMGLGCGLLLLAHAAVYVLANMGAIWPEQVYCPFTMDYKGMAVTYVLFGVMLSIYRYQSITEA